MPISYKLVFNPLEEVFMSHFRVECSYKNYAYLISDANGIVKEVSASAHSYFEISKEKLESETLHIDTLIENAILDNNYFLNDGKEMECNFKN